MKKYEFQAETKQLLDLMIHSIYSNKDIFLRELVSNSSDALDKLRFESLTNKDFVHLVEDPHIRVDIDKDARLLSVEDNGIGMARQEVIDFVGTIAKSGTREFINVSDSAIKTPAANDSPRGKPSPLLILSGLNRGI